MSINGCGLTIYNQQSCMFNPGRDIAAPVAIVLWAIQENTHTYLSSQSNNSIHQEVFTKYPKSVHYFVGENCSIYNLVGPEDQAWGFAEFYRPSWGGIKTYLPETPNDLFIHVGYAAGPDCQTTSKAQLSALADIFCCLMSSYNMPLYVNGIPNILLPIQLDIRLSEQTQLPPSLIDALGICLESGEINSAYSSTNTSSSTLSSLEEWMKTANETLTYLCQCCSDLTKKVAALQSAVADLEANEASAAAQLTELAETVAALEDEVQANSLKLAEHQECIDLICKPQSVPCIQYQLHPQDAITVTPGAERRIYFPTKIYDTNPPTMFGTVLQSLNLTNCTYQIKVTVRFAAAEWCKDRFAELYFNTCSGKVLLQQYVIPDDGVRTVELSGTTTVIAPPSCTENFVSVLTNDVTTPNKVIEFGDIEVCCVDKTCPDEPFEIDPPIQTFVGTL